MMRIKEAIQRKKLIHEMNEEYREFEYDPAQSQPTNCPSPKFQNQLSIGGTTRIGQPEDSEEHGPRLQSFVMYLSGKLTDLQKRALKITWKRLSEAPKTSGRGTLHIMEKVLTKLCEQSPGVTAIFYKSAFLSCIEDRKCGRVQQSSIATIRDHAHILITLVDDILHMMFEGPLDGVKYDPDTIGEAHARLGPLGFERSIWHVFGECFAEVMFMQECIRAYPHAPSAWSLLAVALTDRIFSATKMSTSALQRSMSRPDQLQQEVVVPPPVPPRKNGSRCPFFASTSVHKRSLPSTAQLVNQPGSVMSLDFDNHHGSPNNEEDEVFITARSQFDLTSFNHPPIPPQRRLPCLAMTSSVFNERTPNKQNKFMRSKSEARLRIKKTLEYGSQECTNV